MMGGGKVPFPTQAQMLPEDVSISVATRSTLHNSGIRLSSCCLFISDYPNKCSV